MSKEALAGVRIMDFTQVWAGDYATQLLAFLGAQVIKIESRRRSDPARSFSITTQQLFEDPDSSPVFHDLNLNKVDITLDLTQSAAIQLVKELVKMGDAVAENFRPGVMDRLGLGYKALAQVKPDLVYLSSSTSGRGGPEQGYIGYAPNFAALGGHAHLTGYPDGPPAALSGCVDLTSATTAAFILMAALYHRQQTGGGRYIDMSSRETMTVLLGDAILGYAMTGRVPLRQGNRDLIMAPHNCYRCRGEDKWVSIAIGTEEEWQALCRAMGRPELAQDGRFTDAYQRWLHQEELDDFIAAWTDNYTHYEVMKLLQKAGVAATPSLTSEELFQDPHTRARGLFLETHHARMGRRVVMGPPWRFSQCQPPPLRSAPLLGQHNELVFGELLGLPRQEIARLIEERVIY